MHTTEVDVARVMATSVALVAYDMVKWRHVEDWATTVASLPTDSVDRDVDDVEPPQWAMPAVFLMNQNELMLA